MPAAQRSVNPPRRLKQPLAVVWNRREDADYLGRIDPRTLRVRRLVHLGAQGSNMHDMSPNSNQIAFVRRRSRIRIIDVHSLRRVRDLEGRGGWSAELNWTRSGRLISVSSDAAHTWVRVLDPRSGELLHERVVKGMPLRVKRTARGVVFLIQDVINNKDEPMAAKLVVADDSGRVRSVTLERIKAGSFMPEGERVSRSLGPALAVNREFAVVVGTEGVIARIDFHTMNVSYPTETESFFEEVAAGLLPAADAKFADVRSLWATWINDETIAITSRRTDMDREASNGTFESGCSGIHLLDTNDWSLTRFAAQGEEIKVGSGFVLTHNGDCRKRDAPKIGLVAYDDTGQIAWQLFEGKQVDGLTIRDGLAFVRHGYHHVLRSVVDLKAGVVLRTRPSFAEVLPY
jgi:hypothetical protein